jgi:SAM-dependent methyltransferase
MEFKHQPVLGEKLIHSWQLAPGEAAYIDRQQGHHCLCCQSNLRSRTLAAALLDHFNFTGTLRDFCSTSRRTNSIYLLELNEAGSLSSWLATLPHRTLARYPDVDMQSLPYDDASWEVVLHSDVLEHVENPSRGLRECHRVLTPGGVLLYTIPIVHGRLSRSRSNLPPSHHGAPGEIQSDWLVHTEYGADFWLEPLEVGFRKIGLFTLEGPDTITVVCQK